MAEKTEIKGWSKQLVRVAALALMCIICTGSVITVAALSKDVKIIDGSNSYLVGQTTDYANDKKLLELNHITWDPAKDRIIRDESSNPIILTLQRAFKVTVAADGNTFSNVDTFYEGDTVQDALTEYGVTLGSLDEVQPALSTELTPDMEITVTRGYPVNVTVDGDTKTIQALHGTTVQLALSQNNITLGEQDVSSVELSQPITGAMDLTVDRVGYHEATSVEAVAYETVYTETEELLKGETQVQTAGAEGERTIVTKEKVVNGEVAETQVVSDEVTKQPVAQEVLVGTKVKVKATGYAQVTANGTLIDENGNVVSYSSVLTGGCTAYTSREGSTTATGRPVKYGNIAVNPNVIPYGTKLYVCSPDGSYVYGYAIAADTGGAMMSGQCLADLYYDTTAECYSFGRRTMSIYILK